MFPLQRLSQSPALVAAMVLAAIVVPTAVRGEFDKNQCSKVVEADAAEGWNLMPLYSSPDHLVGQNSPILLDIACAPRRADDAEQYQLGAVPPTHSLC